MRLDPTIHMRGVRRTAWLPVVVSAGLCLLVGAATLHAAGIPNGPEIDVNTTTAGSQTAPEVVVENSGDFLFVWHDSDLGGGAGGPEIAARRFDSSLAPSSPEFLVNTTLAITQRSPGAAFNSAGEFVIAWESTSTGYDILAQRYTAGGIAVGPEFIVNTYTTVNQQNPSLVGLTDDGYCMVWQSGNTPPPATNVRIVGQRLDSAGSNVGGEFQINAVTTNTQSDPRIMSISGDAFLVVWDAVGIDASGHGILARRYDDCGTATAGEFQVNTFEDGEQLYPAMGPDGAGGFVIAWHSFQESQVGAGSTYGIFAQRISAAGSLVGTEFQVNTYTTGDQYRAHVALDNDGGFVVIWNSLNQDGSSTGIFGQRFNSDATKEGPEFAVNSYTTGPQRSLAIGPVALPLAEGGFFVTWEQPGVGGGQTVVAQKFTICGNGVLEGDEECDDGNFILGDGCDQFCAVEMFSCCDDEAESCNSDAACTTGVCCGSGRCNVEGIVAVCDALGAPCATNTDCGAEACCDDDPCGNGLPVDEEECDAGVSGCNPDAPGQCCESQCDAATCLLLGQCTDTSQCCRDASECGVGIGCCGDGTLDPGETCDDGNLDDGDCCSSTCTVPAGCLPACPGVGGAHLLQAASMKAKFDDKNKDDPGKDGDGKYERWKIGKRGQNGDFNLDPGQHTDCRSEEMEISIIENDGTDGVRELGSFTIPPSAWDKKKPSLADDGSVTADDQCKLSDRDELKSVPAGVSKAQWREKGVKVKYRFQGKLLGEIEQPTSFVEPSPGEDPEGQIRICVRVGASAGHSVLSCTLRKGGEQLKCQSE